MRGFLYCITILLCGYMASAAEVDFGTAVDFDTEIVPILSKAGCNTASCHGSAAGQGGFRLSLFGGDPDFDYRTIVNELEGRRVNPVEPTESLVLAKPSGRLEHGGGEVLQLDGAAAHTLADWIASGTPRLRLRQVVQLLVTPNAFVAEKVPASFPLNVTAVFSDGVERDVTRESAYVSQNESALQVDPVGNATITLPGRHGAVIRFASFVKTVSVTTPLGTELPSFPSWAQRNWVDEEINSTLLSLRLSPAMPSDDATFLRRLSLDLTGRLPLPAEVEPFVADENDSKRSALVDRLLQSEAFTDYWTHRLAIQLRFRKPATDDVAAKVFYRWLKDQVANDVGWNEIAVSLILAEGDTHSHGAATVHRLVANARDEAEYMSEVLMGVRLQCANCHNHPLDQWTQDDFHGLAAIFAGLERGQVVRFTGRGEVMHPRTGHAAVPRIPGERFLQGELDQRPQFAEWLTQQNNPYFAKAMVGRIWEALMGRGLVSPVDDLRSTNPASHPQLLHRLTDFFIKNGYRIRPLIRRICHSAAYERSSRRPADSPPDDRFYSYAMTKQLTAEVLADAISDVTGVADDFDGVSRAINVVDRTHSSSKLVFLGQCLPGEGCSTAVSGGRGIASKLHLMNGELLNEKIQHDDGRLSRLWTEATETNEMVSEFYLRALGRPPSSDELAQWCERLDATEDAYEKAARLEDFLWALLNCHEFTTNQ
ncbi:DUF1549 domain-containing protein [Novipirellula artificiosorum]|uniref:Bacterial Ig-like domain (Group 2) n=1 Tax=Novipirellula artificiosorum TaxID=2528016 RepID=A0A5C6E177_9BACT|nr:DUF1549 domain-containing protein [Novipirellula artificiosorum]TWU40939.1 hypothetical protein Poly41_17740 [Novipirellula artificiosorum]